MPALSVVIASINPGPAIAACLDALVAPSGTDVEVIVADASDGDTASTIRRRFPDVLVLERTGAATLPALRGVGLAAAQAPIVAIVDPSCVTRPGWSAEAVRIHAERPEPVIGGPVTLAPSRRRSVSAWSTYLFEYWEFVPPRPDGPASVLSGNNVTYKREVLADGETLRSRGFWKAFVHAGLAAEGRTFWNTAGLEVELHKAIGPGDFFVSRFHHGRSYAAMRVAEAGVVARWARALTTPLLPFVFLARQVRGLIGKPAAFGWLLITTPLMVAYHLSWAAGELWGYLGGPGRSHDALRY